MPGRREEHWKTPRQPSRTQIFPGCSACIPKVCPSVHWWWLSWCFSETERETERATDASLSALACPDVAGGISSSSLPSSMRLRRALSSRNRAVFTSPANAACALSFDRCAPSTSSSNADGGLTTGFMEVCARKRRACIPPLSQERRRSRQQHPAPALAAALLLVSILYQHRFRQDGK